MEGSTNPSFVSDQRKPSGKSGFIFRIIHFLIFTNYFFHYFQKGLLEIATNDVNSHTYVYEPNLSLRRMTIEAFPSEENYAQQDIKNLQDHR